MGIGTLMIDGKRFVVIPEAEYQGTLPPGESDTEANVPAIAYARASLARKLVAGRGKAGWSQAELAQRAGVRVETVSRIENGRNTPDERTFARLTNALRKAGVPI